MSETFSSFIIYSKDSFGAKIIIMWRRIARRSIRAPHYRDRWRRALTSAVVDHVAMVSGPAGVDGRIQDNTRGGIAAASSNHGVSGMFSRAPNHIPGSRDLNLHAKERYQSLATSMPEHTSPSTESSKDQKREEEEQKQRQHPSSSSPDGGVVVNNSSDLKAQTFYRRELPHNHCVAFRYVKHDAPCKRLGYMIDDAANVTHIIIFTSTNSSTDGRRLFQEALQEGGMESYFPLSEQFKTQDDPAFCKSSTNPTL